MRIHHTNGTFHITLLAVSLERWFALGWNGAHFPPESYGHVFSLAQKWKEPLCMHEPGRWTFSHLCRAMPRIHTACFTKKPAPVKANGLPERLNLMRPNYKCTYSTWSWSVLQIFQPYIPAAWQCNQARSFFKSVPTLHGQPEGENKRSFYTLYPWSQGAN